MDLREAQEAGSVRHPWEVARFRFFETILRRHGDCDRDRALQVLDVGSGDAWFASSLFAELAEGSHITCWDAGYTADDLAKSTPAITRTAEKPTLLADVLLLLDVLEHVEDDHGFLRALVEENTHPSSTVLISVPAWNALFTAHDTRLLHYRRYSPASCSALLERCGLRIEQHGGLFHGLLAPRALSKLLEVTRSAVGIPDRHEPLATWNGGPLATKLVSAALALDNRASRLFAGRGLEVPGLSWWALCTTR